MTIVRRYASNRTLTDTLTQGGATVDLTDAAVEFHLRSCETGLIEVRTATVATDPTTGVVSYQLAADDIATSGRYEYEWQVTFDDGTVVVLPESGAKALRVVDNLE